MKEDTYKDAVNRKDLSTINRQKQDELSLVTEKEDNRGTHPNSKANLKPFKMGESGNPDGRPHKYAKLKKELVKYGKKKPISDWDFKTLHIEDNYQKETIKQIWVQAKKGSIQHIKLLADLGCLDGDK
jgi:hypothetical protein|tara:strand:+ start:685 stop:1068 length:384 start_codon:yes stop_codon:yes gene_type:complete